MEPAFDSSELRFATAVSDFEDEDVDKISERQRFTSVGKSGVACPNSHQPIKSHEAKAIKEQKKKTKSKVKTKKLKKTSKLLSRDTHAESQMGQLANETNREDVRFSLESDNLRNWSLEEHRWDTEAELPDLASPGDFPELNARGSRGQVDALTVSDEKIGSTSKDFSSVGRQSKVRRVPNDASLSKSLKHHNTRDKMGHSLGSTSVQQTGPMTTPDSLPQSPPNEHDRGFDWHESRSLSNDDLNRDPMVQDLIKMGLSQADAQAVARNFIVTQESRGPPSQPLPLRNHQSRQPGASAGPTSRGNASAKLAEIYSSRLTPQDSSGSQTLTRSDRPSLQTRVSDLEEYEVETPPDEDFEHGTEHQRAKEVQAIPVMANATDPPIVYADSSPLNLWHALKNRTIQMSLLFAIVVIVVIVVCTTTLIKGGASSQSTNPSALTQSPSSSPLFSKEQIYNWAVNVSGLEALSQPDSPQMNAVLWLSAKDNLNFDSFDLSFLQRYTVLVYYFSTGGKSRTKLESWLDPEEHECHWSDDVSCFNDESDREVIVEIDETRAGLLGSLPLELRFLSELGHLHMANNKINGTIPDIFGYLTKLSYLDMSSNVLTGSIPESIGQATHLVEVHLSNNKILGSIPFSLYDLTMLQTIDLSGNEITGNIVESVARLQLLMSFNVQHNRLSGRISGAFDELPLMDTLRLDYNNFTGSLPNLSVAMRRRLELTMSHNDLTGTIPFTSNDKVRHLDQVDHSFEIRLQKLDLSYNRLTGTIDEVAGMIPSLRYADFSGNKFTGHFPGDVGWDAIEHLASANNQLTGTIPSGWSPALTHLDFGSNKMSGGIPSGLCTFSNLEHLYLDHIVDLNGTIPSCLLQLTTLKELQLKSSSLVGSIPTSIGQLLDLESLDLSLNLFTSIIPSEIGLCTKMRMLDMSNNRLVGRIPSTLGRLLSLESVYVGNNSLTGSIPKEIGKFVNLKALSLSGNDLYGTIPAALCMNGDNWVVRDVGCNIECRCCAQDNQTGC